MPAWDNVQPKSCVCQQCGSEFSAKRNAKYCSPLCSSRARPPRQKPTPEQRREWYRQRMERPGYREKVNAQARARRDKINQLLRDHKMKAGCARCGYRDHHAALEFHHRDRDDKEINLSFAKSVAQAREEMNKCVVLCANCHRIHHFEERSDGYPCKPDIFAATYEAAE